MKLKVHFLLSFEEGQISNHIIDPFTCDNIDVGSESETHSHSLVESNVIVSITVVITYYGQVETYLAVPVRGWGVEYFVIYKRDQGFIKIISEHDIYVLGYHINRLHPVTLNITKNQSSAHFTFKCGIVDNHSENPDFGGIHLTASEPFGVITFQCPFLVSKFVVESVLPVKYHKSHDYITFCVVHLQCRVFIYIPASSAVTVTQYTRNTTDTHFTRDVAELMMFDDWNLKIQSHSYLQVVVSIENTERSLYTELVVMPTSLFTTGYIATVPGEFLEYRLIVTFTSRMLPLFLDNEIVKSYEVLRNTNTTTFSSLAYNIRLSMSSKSIGYRKFTIHTNTSEPFGCYLYGKRDYLCSGSPLSSIGGNQNYTDETLQSAECIENQMKKGDFLDNDCDGRIDEEVVNDIDDDSDGRIDEDATEDTESGCPVGWFGLRCDKKCNCEDPGCKPNGHCKENVTCLEGYFGTQCQYRDAIFWADVSHEKMKFRGHLKCQRKFTAARPLIIKFDEPVRFTWLQIDAGSTESLLGLNLEFESSAKMSCYVGPCLDRRDIYLDNTTLMVLCHIKSDVCRINISMANTKGKRILCSVYVSGGRNIALKQHTWMSSEKEGINGKLSKGSFSVDGHTESKQCARTGKGDNNPTLRVTFHSSMVLEEIAIYFLVINRKNIYRIRFLNDKNSTIFEKNGELQKVVVFSHSNDQYVKSIEVTLLNISNSYMAVCELEAYGECAPSLYGPDCTDICSLSCVDHICTYEGFCRHCPNGTGGRHCFEGCITWCDEYEEWPDVTPTANIHLNSTHTPYLQYNSLSAEQFWYSVMIVMVFVTVFYIFAEKNLNTAEEEDVKERNVKKTPASTETSEVASTVLSSSSVDSPNFIGKLSYDSDADGYL